MRSSEVLILMLSISVTTLGDARQRYPLPPSAQISITSSTLDLGKASILPANPHANCAQYHPSRADIRRQFATYNRIRNWDPQQHRDRLTCEVDGIVKVGGKYYEWQSHQGGVMDTSYPNGVWKTLGDASVLRESEAPRVPESHQ